MSARRIGDPGVFEGISTRHTDSTSARAGRGENPLLVPIRRAARRAVELRSTRKVAAEMDISPAGLRYFLKSGVPYARTMRRMVAWYAEHGYGLDPANGSGDVILAALLDDFPDEIRDMLRTRLLRAVHDTCVENNFSPPSWTRDA